MTVPIAKRVLEIAIALGLIYTAAVWITTTLAQWSTAQGLHGWIPGILLLVGSVALLVKFGDRRNRTIFAFSTMYGAILLFVSIWYGDVTNLVIGFVIGAGLITGLGLLLVRPSVIDCPHCGTANPEKHDFCFKCGNKLRP